MAVIKRYYHMITKMKSLTRKTGASKISQKLRTKKILLRSKTASLLQKKILWQFSNSPLLLQKKTEPEDYQDLTDNELIGVIHKKNREAYRELFARYQKKLFTYIFHLVGNREETEDILQNVFSKTFRNISHFDVNRKFSSWIYRIAHNEAVNFLKRKSKRYTVSWDDIATSKDKLDTASNEELPEEKWAHEEIKKEIDQALEKLPPKYQQVLKLRYFQEYSYEDIGAILKKPVNTVGTLINRAKKKLLEVVKEKK